MYLGNMNAYLGKTKPIELLNSENPKSIKHLKKRGLESYLESTKSLLDMAIESASGTLRNFPHKVDRILICTESHWATNCFDLIGIDRLKEHLECYSAHVMGISFSFCANIQFALNIAQALINSNTDENILIISVDRAESSADRLIGENLSILSDGCSSFVVSKTHEGLRSPFKLISNNLITDSTIKNFTDEIAPGLAGELRGVLKFVGHCNALKNKALAMNDAKKIDRFLSNNYKNSVSKLFSIMFGFRGDSLNSSLLSTHAHVFSSDAIIALIENYNCISSGDTVLTFASGPQAWGSSLLEKI